jgi:hypothetical protein
VKINQYRVKVRVRVRNMVRVYDLPHTLDPLYNYIVFEITPSHLLIDEYERVSVLFEDTLMRQLSKKIHPLNHTLDSP